MKLNDLVNYLHDYLKVDSFNDYAPNGLQVEGRQEVKKIIGGVTACQALLDVAVERQADAIIVHHGYFWKGENACVTGMKRQRLKKLLTAEINLLAYHLPLDAHAEVGNNVQLARQLGFTIQGSFDLKGKDNDSGLALYGILSKAWSAEQLIQHIASGLGREPLHIAGDNRLLQRIAWCSGAAQTYFDAAVSMEVDVFMSGEVSEQCTHIARETGVHYIAAGHHATERFGIKALGCHLQERYAIEFDFVDIDNPV